MSDLIPESLTDREKVFVRAYAEAGSGTFLRGTDSARVVNPNLTPGAARVAAFRLRHTPAVALSIKAILEKQGLGLEARGGILADIAHHEDIGRSVSRTIRAADGAVETTVKQGPGYKDVLKAVEIANKSEGLYAQAQAAVDVAAEEYRQLSRRFFAEGKGGGALPRKLRLADQAPSPQPAEINRS